MDINEYSQTIKELLTSYHQHIENEIMPHLSRDFTKFYMSVSEFYNKLKNKGLIKDDPYQSNSEIIDFILPDTEHFSESESQWKVPERICKFIAILSYVSNNYNFTLDNFTFSDIDKIKKTIEYYDWKGLLNPATADLNTKTLGKIALSFKNSTSDILLIKTFNQSVDAVVKSQEDINNKLKYIFLYLKESYKQIIRDDIIPLATSDTQNKNNDPTILLKAIKTIITNDYPYINFYKKYILEVLAEMFGNEADELQEVIIKHLSRGKKIEKAEDKGNEDSVDPKIILIKTLLEIGKIRQHMGTAVDKMYINHTNLSEKTVSFIGKIIMSISIFLFNTKSKTTYNITLPSSGKKTNYSLCFEEFYDDVKKIEYELLNFTEEDKIVFYLNNKDLEITRKIDKILMNIKKQVRYLIGLDDFFKRELKIKKQKSRGIKPEITVLKSLINSSTTIYREYIDSVDS
ncbi:MAG: hypothetical protein B6229_05820 [Spirochaetaceae bacterium 4572_7]|nr:MAG: hypothetical protein B6229_05820 [Spirochaetaceae bacterium 4572_7]